MVDTGTLKPADAKRLGASKLDVVPPERRRTTGQYYLDYVLQYLEAQYGADLVFKGDVHEIKAVMSRSRGVMMSCTATS